MVTALGRLFFDLHGILVNTYPFCHSVVTTFEWIGDCAVQRMNDMLTVPHHSSQI